MREHLLDPVEGRAASGYGREGACRRGNRGGRQPERTKRWKMREHLLDLGIFFPLLNTVLNDTVGRCDLFFSRTDAV